MNREVNGLAHWPRALQALAQLISPSPDLRGLSDLTRGEWTECAELVCDRHRVAPLVAQRLTQSPIPIESASRIQAVASANARAALVHLAALRDIVDVLADLDVVPLVLKGLPLAKQLYGGTGNRHARDLDLGIPEQRLSNTVHALAKIGYVIDPEHRLRGRIVHSKALVRECNDLALRHKSSGIVVELHWRCHHFRGWPNWLADPERIQTIKFVDRRIRALADGANLIYLCTHGAMHQWGRLKWLADVARMAIHRGPDGILHDLELARRLKSEGPLMQGLGLAARIGWLDPSILPRSQTSAASPAVLKHCLSTIADPAYAPGRPAYRIGFYREGLRLAGSHSQRIGVLRYGTWRRASLLMSDLRERMRRA